MDLARGKQADIIQHCIYEISTGKWIPGQKLPSVRKAETLWRVNRLTVLGAYRELEKMGLVISKDRSGYYVNEDRQGSFLSGHTSELNELYEKVKIMISKESKLDLSYIFNYFNTKISSESIEKPNYAFIECTSQQAEGHASEIYKMLRVHVQPIQLHENYKKTEIPDSVKVLMTTGFHINEVDRIAKSRKKHMMNIPIEVDAQSIKKVFGNIENGLVIEFESNMSSNITQDIRKIVPQKNIDQSTINKVNEIEGILKSTSYEVILLSPRVWGNTSEIVKKDKRVKLIRFKISDSSWNQISQTFNIPLN